MKELLFDILFSSEMKGSEKIDKLEFVLGEQPRTINLNCSSVEFYKDYLQRILDEFAFIYTLKWCKWDEQYIEGDPYEMFLAIAINDIDFLFTLDVDRKFGFSSNREKNAHCFHPSQYNPTEILPDFLRKNLKAHGEDFNEWLRFIDGFLLFCDLEFYFSKKNESEPNLSLFQFEEKKGEDGYWIFNEGYIEDDGENGEYGYAEYLEFELKRKGHNYLCVSRMFIPEPPLPPK